MVTADDEVLSFDGRAPVVGLAMTSWRSGFLSRVLGEGTGKHRRWPLEDPWTGCDDDALVGGGDPDDAASQPAVKTTIMLVIAVGAIATFAPGRADNQENIAPVRFHLSLYTPTVDGARHAALVRGCGQVILTAIRHQLIQGREVVSDALRLSYSRQCHRSTDVFPADRGAAGQCAPSASRRHPLLQRGCGTMRTVGLASAPSTPETTTRKKCGELRARWSSGFVSDT